MFVYEFSNVLCFAEIGLNVNKKALKCSIGSVAVLIAIKQSNMGLLGKTVFNLKPNCLYTHPIFLYPSLVVGMEGTVWGQGRELLAMVGTV